MVQSQSLKTTIIVSMVSLSLLTAGIVGTVAIINSTKIIAKHAKEALLTKANTTAEQVYTNFKTVEKNVRLMANIVGNQSNLPTVSAMQQLKNRAKAEQAYAKIRAFPQAIGMNTPWCLSSYFYYNQEYIPSYDGAWYVKDDTGAFVREIVNTPIVAKDGGWYFNPILYKKGVWAEPYEDESIHVNMISYSEPLYKNGLLLGVAGMDIQLAELDKVIKNINIYKDTNAFMINKEFDFIVGDSFTIGDNLAHINKGQYQFLINTISTKTSGYAEYQGKKERRLVSFSRLPNGFTLLMDVPLAAVLTEMNNLMGLLLTILAIGVLISVGISVKIGTVISNKIVDASKEIAEGSQHMMQACEEGAIRSHQLSQGATNMASSIAEEAESVNDCVNNIAEMSHAIQGIISNANTMVQLAKTSTTNATLGNTLADHSINTISKIKSLTTEACHSTQTLNTLIAKLESIVALIKNITEQTNLLALNATIEAVRAGEQGKGFYIVAGEVKELAAQSAEATITVSQLIQQIQAEVKNVVNSIENNTQIVEEGVSAIESVGTNLGEILTVTSQVTLQAEEVSSLLTDSAINPEKLLATMRNISTVIKQSATNTHQMALATQEQTNSIEIINTHSHTLSQTAKTLEELVTAFKL